MTLPTLLVTYTADNCVFPGDFQGIVDAIGSTDKRVEAVVADHYGNPVGSGGHRDRAASLIHQWLEDLG